jgi:hypothetical protein
METDRQTYNTINPKKQIDQTEYVQKQKRKYPLLSADVVNIRSTQKDSKFKPVQTALPEPVKKPPVKVPDNYKATVNERGNSKQTEQNIQPQSGKVQNSNVNRQQPSEYVNPQPNNTISKQRTDNVNVQQKNPAPVQRTENSNQIREAQQYHQNTWNQIQPQSQPVRQPPQQNISPAPRQQVSPPVQQPAKQNTQTPSNNKRK